MSRNSSGPTTMPRRVSRSLTGGGSPSRASQISAAMAASTAPP
jgi:hypothetical protein